MRRKVAGLVALEACTCMCTTSRGTQLLHSMEIGLRFGVYLEGNK